MGAYAEKWNRVLWETGWRLCEEINTVGKKSRGKTHGLRLILSHSDIFESLYSTDYISLMFTWNWLNSGYFTHVPKFCIGNLVKL